MKTDTSIVNCVATAMGLCILLASLVSLADETEDKEQARRHFEAGKSLMKVDDYETATVQFEKSVELFPTKAAMLNLANCYLALHDYHNALEWYQRLKFKYKESLGDDLMAVVNEHIREIGQLAAKLKITADPIGSTVLVDGKEVGTTPLTSYVIVAPGKHSIVIAKTGFVTFRKEATTRLGSTTLIETKLVRPGSPPVAEKSFRPKPVEAWPSARIEPAPEKQKKTAKRKKKTAVAKSAPKKKRQTAPSASKKKLSKVPFYISGGTTLALGVAWVAVDIKTKSLYDMAKAEQNLDLKIKGERLQNVDGVLLGFTLAGLAATATLAFFTNFKAEKEEPKERTSASKVNLGGIVPFATDSGGGVHMAASF